VEGRKKKNFKKNGNCPIGAGVDPRPAGDRWSTPTPVGQFKFFEIFLFKKKGFLEVWVMGQGF
jgi:hypothetical protein